MVKGLDLFRERFRGFEGSFVLIGGAACDDWFSAQGLVFRATNDLDLVLIIEVLDESFIAAMRHFIAEGDYQLRERTEGGPPILYRFAKPTNPEFPAMLEMFTRRPESVDLSPDQTIVPIPADEDHHSLSAILLNEPYYQLIRKHHRSRDGLAIADATALLPLKAHAWLDLSARRAQGEKIDEKNITKHRNDVFRLAATLPGESGPELPQEILDDLRRFLESFPADSSEWPAILAAIKNTVGGAIRPQALVEAIKTFFRL